LNAPAKNKQEITVGLRVDVDTFRGTRDGVPGLLKILNRHELHATFFFSVGPDNMGRHLWRLLKPAFLIKMLRSKAASLYGWDILLRGTFWPGPEIAKNLASVISDTERAGHEVGLHSWDHHRWQMSMHKMNAKQIHQDIKSGVESLDTILKQSPRCSAVAGWKANQQVVIEKNQFDFTYNSDCRGKFIFRPVINGVECAPQIPATLPTYDEIIGHDGITVENYNDHMLALIKPDQLNILTIHAEVEGIVCATMFDEFLTKAKAKNIRFVPMGDLLPEDISTLPVDSVITAPLPGREGWVCWQASLVA